MRLISLTPRVRQWSMCFCSWWNSKEGSNQFSQNKIILGTSTINIDVTDYKKSLLSYDVGRSGLRFVRHGMHCAR